MKLEKQQLIIVGLSVVILCGFGIFQYIPVFRQKHVIREGMTQQDLLSERICAQSVRLPELKQQEKQLQEELIPFYKKLPQGRQFSQLWQQIADVMTEGMVGNIKEHLAQSVKMSFASPNCVRQCEKGMKKRGTSEKEDGEMDRAKECFEKPSCKEYAECLKKIQ